MHLHINKELSTGNFFASYLLIICLFIQTLGVPTIYASTRAVFLLKQGIREYEEADFQKAAQSIQEALKRGFQEDKDRIEAHQYLAYIYTVFGDRENARLEFIKLLKIDPKFRLLPDDSPHFREVFQLALDSGLKDDQLPVTQDQPKLDTEEIVISTPLPEDSEQDIKKKPSKKWMWITAGAVVVGGAAAVVLLSGSDGTTESSKTGIIEIEIPDQP